MRELENQNKAYQSNISYLDVSIEQMQVNLNNKDKIVADNEILQKEVLQLKEEVEACKQLIQEKHAITQGQE